jgi:YHS domain-containing protein
MIKGAKMEKDPVCGMDVDPKNAAAKSDYHNKTYYFCSLGCKKEFDQSPEKYLNNAKSISGD